LIVDIPISLIDANPHNSRSLYDPISISRLADSLQRNGQLSVIVIRNHPKTSGRYQVVFGHRRLFAAKHLNWKTIRAEIVDIDEKGLGIHSLIENLDREGLSDFEKALTFEKLSKQFNLTYDEIGRAVGISRQHISNYLAMLRLFGPKDHSRNPEITHILNALTEHHARIISRVDDIDTRMDLARMAVRKNLSVRDLTNIIGHLRSWFNEPSSLKESNFEPISSTRQTKIHEYEEVSKVIFSMFDLSRSGDFDSCEKMHLFGEGFSLYSAIPPLGRFEGEEAVSKEREWFYEIAPNLSWKFNDLKINFLGKVSVATLTIQFFGGSSRRSNELRIRGTVVLVKKGAKWKILHEHWSNQSLPSRTIEEVMI